MWLALLLQLDGILLYSLDQWQNDFGWASARCQVYMDAHALVFAALSEV